MIKDTVKGLISTGRLELMYVSSGSEFLGSIGEVIVSALL
jgi:hypothetical protein